ncbi:DUF6869 domain-containing protein [Stenotrophomonas humi]
METRSPSALAEEWIERWSTPGASAGSTVEASVLDRELPRKQPNLCLAVILEVLGRIDASSPNQLLGMLAAGPLEDLLNHNGDAVLAEVDLLARRDPGFRLLLNGVWDSGIKPDVLTRLAKYRSNPW